MSKGKLVYRIAKKIVLGVIVCSILLLSNNTTCNGCKNLYSATKPPSKVLNRKMLEINNYLCCSMQNKVSSSFLQ